MELTDNLITVVRELLLFDRHERHALIASADAAGRPAEVGLAPFADPAPAELRHVRHAPRHPVRPLEEVRLRGRHYAVEGALPAPRAAFPRDRPLEIRRQRFSDAALLFVQQIEAVLRVLQGLLPVLGVVVLLPLLAFELVFRQPLLLPVLTAPLQQRVVLAADGRGDGQAVEGERPRRVGPRHRHVPATATLSSRPGALMRRRTAARNGKVFAKLRRSVKLRDGEKRQARDELPRGSEHGDPHPGTVRVCLPRSRTPAFRERRQARAFERASRFLRARIFLNELIKSSAALGSRITKALKIFMRDGPGIGKFSDRRHRPKASTPSGYLSGLSHFFQVVRPPPGVS